MPANHADFAGLMERGDGVERQRVRNWPGLALVIIGTLASGVAPASADNWTRTLDNQDDEIATGVVAGWGGGWLAAGDLLGASPGTRDGLAARYDARGQLRWLSRIGLPTLRE